MTILSSQLLEQTNEWSLLFTDPFSYTVRILSSEYKIQDSGHKEKMSKH